MTMTIGRVGTDVDVELNSPVRWSSGSVDIITGRLVAATFDDTMHLRDELRSMGALARRQKLVVPCLWPSSPTLNGYYHVQDVTAVTEKTTDRGLVRFDVSAQLLGRFGDVQVRAHLDGTVLENDYGIGAGDASFWHSPGASPLAYDGGPTGSTSISRNGALSDDPTNSGAIAVYTDQTAAHDPKWLIDPENYYDGSCRVTVDGYLRAGLLAPNTETGWAIDNGIIRITPGDAGGGISNGQIILEAHSGSASGWDATTHAFRIIRQVSTLTRWHTFKIIRNDPELVIVELVRDADTAPAGSDRHTLQLTLYRGAPFVSCLYSYSAGANTYTVEHASQETAVTTNMTPTGAGSPIGIRRSADDTDGNRWMLASQNTTTDDAANGGLDWAATTELKFLLGFERDAAAPGAGNDSQSVLEQYMGYRNGGDEIVPA